MACNSLDVIFKSLEELEDQGNLSVHTENYIRSLRVEFKFVRIFFKWMEGCGRLGYFQNVFFESIGEGLQNAEKQLLESASNCNNLVETLHTNYFKIIERSRYNIWESFGEYLQNHQNTVSEYEVDIHQVIVELFNPVEENLKYLIGCADGDLPDSLKEQIKKLEEKLRFLKNFFKIAEKAQEKMKNQQKKLENLLNRIKVLAETAAVLSYLCWHWTKNIYKEIHLKSHLFDLLLKINHIEPEIRIIYVEALNASAIEIPGILEIDVQALFAVNSLLDNLQELLHLNVGSVVPDDHQIGILCKELRFLKYFLMDPSVKQYVEPERFHSLLVQIQLMAREAGTAIHSFPLGQTKFDMDKEMNILLHDLLKNTSLVKAEIREICQKVPKPPASHFPRTPKMGLVGFFLQNLSELLSYRADSVALLKNEVEKIQGELVLVTSVLTNTLKKCKETEELKVIEQRLINVAYEAECVIDSITVGNGPFWYCMLWLSDVMEELMLLNTEVMKIDDQKMCDMSAQIMETASHQDSARDNAPVDEEVVGFKDQEVNLKNQLQRGSEQLDIVSIIGMPGLGKTTLAKKLYEGPSITSHFRVRSWCCISQVYERRSLLLHILDDIIGLTDKLRKMDDDDLADKVYKSLKRRKYLIVLDDVWNIEVWNDLRSSFPDDHNGSRIMLTSRDHDVAVQAKPGSSPHHLRLFSEEESWELLQKKVFQQKSCPPNLSIVGKQIARQCKGLPLSVVVVAGFLRKTIKNEDHWKQIAENLGKHIVGKPGHCMAALELSYKYLSDHLKPCFLYFGIFPEDREIPVQKLIWLWMGEGFVRKTDEKSLEDVAEGYLMDLIGRSLVIVAKSKSNGGVKACQIHDLLHEFCLEKAKQENFLMLLHGNEKQFTSSDGLECNFDSDNIYILNPEQHRMCIYSDRENFYGWRPSNPHVRSVHFFGIGKTYMVGFSFMLYSLKLLRVLDLYSITMGKEFPNGIELLVHLRYLALRGETNSVPSSISNLWKLETFLVKGLRGEVELPDTLWEMSSLRHICVDDRAVSRCSNGVLENYFKLDNLETLATPFLHFGDNMEKILRRLRNLRKLKCIFGESWNLSRRCNQFPVLDFLSKLESLKVFYHGKVQYPCEFTLPPNLKKLTLSKFCLPWSAISDIGKLLPKLEVLKLLFKASEGQRWDVGDGEFSNLKFLRLDGLKIAQWNADCDHFPRLQRLVLQRCKLLEEVPSSFGEISTLETIEVRWCSHSAAMSVRQIQEEQMGMGNDGFKVLIHPLASASQD